MRNKTTKNILFLALLFGVLSAVTGGAGLLIGLLLIFVWFATTKALSLPSSKFILSIFYRAWENFWSFYFLGIIQTARRTVYGLV